MLLLLAFVLTEILAIAVMLSVCISVTRVYCVL